MYGTYFYFATLRKLTAVFGNMFTNLQIQRTDGTNTKLIDVPISFAPKEAFLIKLNEVSRNGSDINTQMTLPRMSFEIAGLDYDQERKLDSLRSLRSDDTELNKFLRQYNPMPYKVSYVLDAYTKNIDDALQIVEQIVPQFKPAINVTVNDMPLMGANRDIPFVLDSVAPQMSLDGILGETERLVNWSFAFTASAWLYPPIRSANIIKKVIENIESNDNGKTDMIITTSVDPIDADFDDAWTIKVVKEEF